MTRMVGFSDLVFNTHPLLKRLKREILNSSEVLALRGMTQATFKLADGNTVSIVGGISIDNPGLYEIAIIDEQSNISSVIPGLTDWEVDRTIKKLQEDAINK